MNTGWPLCLLSDRLMGYIPHMNGVNQQSSPLVSIGMPVHNGMPFIEPAVRSLLDQSHSNLEIIISDDCSQDGTLATCSRLAAADPRIRVVAQPAPLGMWDNFQFVLGQATGRWFMWAAQDDIWHADWVESALEELTDNRLMSVGSFCTVDEEERPIHMFPPVRFSDKPTIRVLQVMYTRVTGLLMYGVFDRVKLVETGAFSGLKSFGRHAEHLFLFRVASRGQLVQTSRSLMLKRVYGSGGPRALHKPRSVAAGLKDVASECGAYLRLSMPPRFKALIVCNTIPFFAFLLLARVRGTPYAKRNV